MDAEQVGQALLDALGVAPGDVLLVIAFTPESDAGQRAEFQQRFPLGPGQYYALAGSALVYMLGPCPGVSWQQREYLDAAPIVARWDDFSE